MPMHSDVVVYGGTPAGIVAAVTAARASGWSCWSRGGMSAGS